MAPLEGLSDAHAILLATQSCTTGDVTGLPALQAHYPHCFPLERLLRIVLTYLPESTEPSTYVSVLQQLTENSPSVSGDCDIDISAVKDLSEAVARKRVRRLRLRPLKREDEEEEVESADPLTQFLIHRAYLIDTETALQPLILGLLLPFYEERPIIRTWLISSLLPALRLNYEYYPNRDETISLETLELMDDQTAINVLLSITGSECNNMDLVNNLRGLIGPWLYGSNRAKRRRLNESAHQNSISFVQGTPKPQPTELAGWEYVNEWLLSRSLVDHSSVVGAFTNWNGPVDIDLGGYDDNETQISPDQKTELLNRYGQSGLSVVYAHADSSQAALDGSFQVVARVARLLELEEFSYLDSSDSALPSVDYDTERISSTSRASLLQNALLAHGNPLTKPSPSSISFLSALLLSLRILTQLGHLLPCRVVANLALHSSEEMQLAELKSVVSSAIKQQRSRQNWDLVRQQLLWLRDWQAEHSDNGWEEPSTHHGLFWKISREAVETEILKALLSAREYQLAVDLYTQPESPLNASQVEAAVVEAIFAAYDNASNGNRTRGGMKKAYDILQEFQPHFQTSIQLKQISSLIAATHALSFYSLTLQHGVPFEPVSIRVHHDPLSLVEKVLDQNVKSYTKLDDLISIGRNLVKAGLPTHLSSSEHESHHQQDQLSGEDLLVTAERRITSLAISSALNSNDFGTAYSYILTRLTPPSMLPTSSPLLTTPTVPDDISWRAVYNAGRYRSASPNTSASLQSQITHLSQRMELLSLALTLVPSPDPLPEILGAWRRCDEEMSSLRAREQQEEDVWDAKGDSLSTVPGGFGPTDSERDAFDTAQQRAARRARARAAMPHAHPHEAPMGLFEVARGAAMALHKNAFPLRGAADASRAPASAGSGDAERSFSPDQGEGRVRKRDMVSNMVTGGLASGIGWVLGAEPVNR
ncbi:uncharacterized protein N7496_009898 [Penicillium cataractarum]|uniref:Sec39 domain-containing protein n=1 Tax=Penicillium cataractarum TaxID=2100454 RepID=A0A9W9RR71_9EURO|nr:uncharacterized protein N7496_009898 [Penicillium cataractarum]KAJ5364185.1 hypothetical protein N7496_009898 [Penicillium cataractarum]